MTKSVIKVIQSPAHLQQVMLIAHETKGVYDASKMYSYMFMLNRDSVTALNAALVADQPHALVFLFKCLSLFPEQSETALKSLRDETLKLMNEKGAFGNVYSDFLKHGESLKKCSHVVGLLQDRKRWLQENTKNKPVFSWSFPLARLPAFPAVEQFLRSDKTEMELKFKLVRDLRNFIREYSDSGQDVKGFASGFSVDITEIKSVKVALIRKTKKFYEKIAGIYNDRMKQIKQIDKFLALK